VNVKRLLSVLVVAGLAAAVFAQDQNATPPAPGGGAAQPAAPAAGDQGAAQRVITIDDSGGTQSGNLRYGPIDYKNPQPFGLKATVSTLEIYGHHAVLRAPPNTSIFTGGHRTATFDGGVKVVRDRLTATGPTLQYSEATGLGTLEGGVSITVAPAKPGDADVTITAHQVAFEVDTDRSTSTGAVSLVNGNQSAMAGKLVYEEKRGLGQLTDQSGQVTITRVDADGKKLTITADEIRVLTDQKRLYATGNVTVVDGSITSKGASVFFDDSKSIAEILGTPGHPATAVDSKNGSSLRADRIRQDVQYDYFEAIDASAPSQFDKAAFDMNPPPGT
jgi:lipopolysaccharide assembly outer membrane protein LptD (OstA)